MKSRNGCEQQPRSVDLLLAVVFALTVMALVAAIVLLCVIWWGMAQ